MTAIFTASFGRHRQYKTGGDVHFGLSLFQTHHSSNLCVMNVVEEEDAVVQHMCDMFNAFAQFALDLFCNSVLAFERKFVSFSGLLIECSILHRHMHNCESSLVPALKLRQVVNVERYSETIRLAIDHMTCELDNASAQKKCSIFKVASDFRVLKRMIGFDTKEFASLFNLCLPCMRKEFPRTPDACDENTESKGVFRLNLRLILFLTLMRCRHLNSFCFLNGLVGFNHGHLNVVNNRCELVMLDALREECLQKPSIDKLKIDAKYFYDAHSFNGIRFHIRFMQDCGYHALCRPLDDDIQEIFCARCKHIHALKMSVVCAVTRKWMCEVATFAGRASDITAWKEQPFAQLITEESGVLGLADKGMNDQTETRLVTPCKITQMNRAMWKCLDKALKKKIKRSCIQFSMDVSKGRVCNEIMIGDLCRWAAARGSGNKKTYHDLNRIKIRIEVCRGLTNFAYRQRNLG